MNSERRLRSMASMPKKNTEVCQQRGTGKLEAHKAEAVNEVLHTSLSSGAAVE